MIILKILLGIICYIMSIIIIASGVKLGLKSYFKELKENENKSSE